MERVSGTGRTVFAAVPLAIGGVLNGIYGIAALGNSSFFVGDAHYIFASLRRWSLVSRIVGILELVAALSIFQRGAFGQYFAIFVGTLVTIGALLGVPTRPFWFIAVFALTLWIIRGLTTITEPEPGS